MGKIDLLAPVACKCGADGAVLIFGRDIVLSREFLGLCEANSCGHYGKCWMCPPDVGAIDAQMARVRSFDRGLLYQTIAALEDSFDIEGMEAGARRHALVSQEIQRTLGPMLQGEIFHMSCGACNLCARCAKRDDLPCRFPERALPPMEACGINVYNTCRSTSLKYINGANSVTYFGLMLFKGEDNA